jgi:hypothetical protein
MKMVIDTVAKTGVDTVIMGMPHRLVIIIDLSFCFSIELFFDSVDASVFLLM